MNRTQALKVLAVCLAVATVVLAYYTVQTSVYAYSEFEMISYWAEEIDYSAVAWNLTEPDPIILEAISIAGPAVPSEGHPNCWLMPFVEAHRNETNFIDQVHEHGDIWEIAYNGTYYYITCLGSCDPHPSPDLWIFPEIYVINDRREAQTRVGAADISLGAVWVVWAIGWRKLKPEP